MSAFSYCPDYFSLEDILSTQSRVPSQCVSAVSGLGFLNPSLDSDDLPAGAKLELPYWQLLALVKAKCQMQVRDLFRVDYLMDNNAPFFIFPCRLADVK